jgi:TolB-like protein
MTVGAFLLLVVLWRFLPGDDEVVPVNPGGFLDSVAVLPVVNLTGDTAFDLVADAVTYDVINELNRIKELKVTSLQSVRALSEADLRPQQLGDSLAVRLILTASLRRAGDAIRLGAELIEAASDNSVWTRRWDIDASNGMRLERGAVSRLVDGIVATANVIRSSPEEPEMRHGPGYEAYLKGAESLGMRTHAGVNQAIAHFREAISLDPEYAPAYASISTAYSLAIIYRYNIGLGGYETAGRALAAANRAIELNPNLAAGYAARGLLASRSVGPTDQAAADFRRALELQPNAPEQPSWYAGILAGEGRTVEAMASAERGVSLSPYSPARHLALAIVAFELNGYGIASREARRVHELEPEITVSRSLEGHALLLAGRLDQCLQVEFGPHMVVFATCLHELGRVEEATAIVDSVIREVNAGTVVDDKYTEVLQLADLAAYFAWIGDTTNMFVWLERAFDVSPTGVWARLLNTTLFGALHNTPATSQRLDSLKDTVWARVEAAARRATLP